MNADATLSDVKIDQDSATKIWTLSKDGVSHFESKSANCPASAIEWTPVAAPDDALIDVVCSNGK